MLAMLPIHFHAAHKVKLTRHEVGEGSNFAKTSLQCLDCEIVIATWKDEQPPRDYVVAKFKDQLDAVDLALAINAYGKWDAIVRDNFQDLWEVVLPGTCVEGTEKDMRHFLEGWHVGRQQGKVRAMNK